VEHRRHPRAQLTVEGRRLLVQRICDLWLPAGEGGRGARRIGGHGLQVEAPLPRRGAARTGGPVLPSSPQSGQAATRARAGDP